MKETGPGGGETRPEEIAAYIAAITLEMGRLARKHNLGELGYLLDLARMEAVERSRLNATGDSQRIA